MLADVLPAWASSFVSVLLLGPKGTRGESEGDSMYMYAYTGWSQRSIKVGSDKQPKWLKNKKHKQHKQREAGPAFCKQLNILN